MHGRQRQHLPGRLWVQQYRLLGHGQRADEILRDLHEEVFKGMVMGMERWIGDDLEHIHLWSL
ncbi:hypothetical protein D3C85_1846850 [compost metagenome]